MAEATAVANDPAEKVATAARKTPARKTAAKRTPAKRKTATRKAAPRKSAARKSAARQDFASRAQEVGRDAFLASLGFYGKAFDQAQEQFESLQERLEQRRKKANQLYRELVKRGEKVEADAKDALEDLELPKIELESLTDRKKLEAQLQKVKARFEELKETVGLKSAA